MKVYFTSLGCRLNQAEIDLMARRFQAAGHRVLAEPTRADWIIVNTCTVTHVAARKTRALLRRLHRQAPQARLAAVGCYATTAAQELCVIAGVELLIPNAQKDRVLEHVLRHSPVRSSVTRPALFPLARPLPAAHTRGFVKIQDGCDNHCAYCIVTVARGPSRSRPPEEVLAEIEMRLAEGAQEIVLTGVDVGAYGCDRGPLAVLKPDQGWHLARLIETILERTDLPRLRLSSIEPWDVTPELLALWPNPRLCRHFHLSLQSGCDATLARMGRRYDSDYYRDVVEAIRERLPLVGLSTDVMVAFPGETEAEFEESLRFVEEVGFSRLHVFKYSPREGTPAADMPDQVDPRVANRRSHRMTALGERLAGAFCRRLKGRHLSVLFEQSEQLVQGQAWSGWTDNYVRAHVSCQRDLKNEIAWVHCQNCRNGELIAALAENASDS